MAICLSGENSFRLDAELAALTGAFIRNYGEMAIERLDGESASLTEIQASLQSPPFLTERKMVVLRTPGANREFAEAASRILDGAAPTADVVLVEPKLDKRSSYYKFLKKSTDFREFNELDENALAQWLVGEAKSRGGSLQTADAHLLVGRIGMYQRALSNELEKLLLFRPVIDRESIELLTEATPQSTIFELMEAAFAGNAKLAQELYRQQREQKVDPSQIIALLTWQLRIMALIKAARGRSAQDIANAAKLNPYVVRKTQPLAERTTVSKIRQLVADLLTIDVRSKREGIDADEALLNYLLLKSR